MEKRELTCIGCPMGCALTVELENGTVTAVGEGEATITASTPEGRNATCKVYTGAVAAQKQQSGGAFRNLFQ